ncbi:MAG: ABC transporter ATP-binding protein [Helicobacter sp.]|nr:ABC transporter ATP-binding protein [Helicobacter sp.]
MNPVIKIDALSAGFTHGFQLENISFELGHSEVLGIVGESGSGKTLLSSLILGLGGDCKIYSGKISLFGEDATFLNETSTKKIEKFFLNQRRQNIGYIPQNALSALNPLKKIGIQVIESLKLTYPNISKAEIDEKVSIFMNEVGLSSDLLKRYPYELSGGQNQRILIMQNLLKNPKVLICDEPTTALDMETQAQILSFLFSECKNRNISVIFITHDLEIAKNHFSKIIVMEKGKIAESGVTSDIFESPKKKITKDLIKALKLPTKSIKKTKNVLLQLNDFGSYVIQKSLFRKNK